MIRFHECICLVIDPVRAAHANHPSRIFILDPIIVLYNL